MDFSLLSSSPIRNHELGQEHKTITRAKVRALRKSGLSYSKIKELTSLQRSSI